LLSPAIVISLTLSCWVLRFGQQDMREGPIAAFRRSGFAFCRMTNALLTILGCAAFALWGAAVLYSLFGQMAAVPAP
jgi:hypothetical protein